MSADSMDHIVGVIRSFSRRGIRLWAKNGHLHYKAPKGGLAPEEIDALKTFKDRIIPLLEGTVDTETAEPQCSSVPKLNYVPLTFTQLARWNLYQLGTLHSASFVPSALRLRGPLNIDALRVCVAEVVRRHDALRTRIPVRDGTPVQEVAAPGNFEMDVGDLTALAEESREIEIKRRFEKHAFEPVDVAVGPLFRAKLLIIAETEHVLLLSMHHIISDGFSKRILEHEILTAYSQAANGEELRLPTIPLQFSDYADWQRRTIKSWTRRHSSYWESRTKGCQRLSFPSDRTSPADTHLGWGSVSFQLDATLKAELNEWCRSNRTTLVMSVFTAYIALVLRWCDTTEAVFLYETDGRTSQALQSAIGYFAFPLYLPIRIAEKDTFTDLLAQVTEEYCTAHEHADFNYMEVQEPMPPFVRNTLFNWVGRDSGADLVDSRPQSIEVSQIPCDNKMVDILEMDMEPHISILETAGSINGSIFFPLSRFSDPLMSRFALNIPAFVEALVRMSTQRVKDVPLLGQTEAVRRAPIRKVAGTAS